MKQKRLLEVELHLHTEESKADSAASAEEMIQRAKELGCQKIAVTEHGVLTSADTIRSICQELNIEYVPAVESYVRLSEDSLEGRCHLCLYAKDESGYFALGEAVTESFSHMEQGGFPVMDEKLLKKYFGHGADGHGHIIASSACISGVLSRILLRNQILKKQMEKAQKAIEKIGNVDFDESELDAANAKLANLESAIAELAKTADKKYGMRKRALNKLKDDNNYELLVSQLEQEEAETQAAKEGVRALKETKKNLKKQITVLNHAKQDANNAKEKAAAHFNRLETCRKNLTSEETLYALAKEKAVFYSELFGDGNFYIELQYHGMEEEAEVMPKLAQIATECGLPVVITNDAHMAREGFENVRARQIMRSIRNIQNKSKTGNMWVEAESADSELYIKTEEELSAFLSKILPEKTIQEGIAGRRSLLNSCHVDFSSEPHYPKFPTKDGETAEECLRRKTAEGIPWRYPEGMDDERKSRMEHELDIMCQMGYADYHLIVQDYVRYGKLIGKFDFDNLPDGFEENRFDTAWLKEKSKGLVGVGVGPARGSAAGSIVCYLLGITDIDPVTYGLLFERFLNPERVSMPDIDVDFATYLRDYVFDYVSHKYGSDKVCHIMTRNRQKAKAAIDNCAKLLGDKLYGSTTHFQAISDKLKSMVCEGVMPEREFVSLKFGSDKNALRIYDDACLVEGTFTYYGMHAAGVVISDGVAIRKRVPLMIDTSSGALKTQCDMVQVEEQHHLLKMDFLGLLNLDVIAKTLRLVEKNHGIAIDIHNIPFEAEVFKNIYANGFTNGIFQVESSGMKQMLRRAKPKCIEDIIILISMYRPGPMDFLDDLIQVMNGNKKASFLVPELEPILGKTYGAIVYQEQVMQIFQSLAGYSLGGADTVRRYMSKKKMDKLVKEEKAFIYGDEERHIPGCVSNGIPEAAAKTLFGQMSEFAKYAFNKSHAAAYAIVSYQTAWLKYHYPKEYLCVCFSAFPADKRKGFLSDAKALNIPVLPPDINRSEADFDIKDGCIYYGLRHILNVSSKAKSITQERKENGPYKSLPDFVARTYFQGNVLEHLIMCGAFDQIMPCGRKAMAEAASAFLEPVKTIKDKRKKLKSEGLSEKVMENTKKAIQTAISVLEAVPYSPEQDVLADNLHFENKWLGVMLSGHPASEYPNPETVGAKRPSEVFCGKNITVMGAIVNLRITQRKSDGKSMAFFNLDMPDGMIHACCFAETYLNFKHEIFENAVVKCTGNVSEKEDDFSEETFLEIVVKTIKKVPRKRKEVILYGEKQSKSEWQRFRNGLKRYETNADNPNGLLVILYNGNINAFQKTDIYVTSQIAKSGYHISF